MQPFTLSGTSVAASLTGFASNVTGATFTLTANDANDDLAHKVTVKNDSATDHSGKTVALVGTDADGRPQTETLTGPGTSATVTSSKYFLTLTSATPSATIGSDTFDIGWAADAVTASFYPDKHRNTFSVGFECSISGSPTYTVQHAMAGTTWYNHSTVAAKTVAAAGSYTTPVSAIRLLFTAAGTVTVEGIQA